MKGPGTIEQQIEKLRSKMKSGDIADAAEIVCNFSSDTIALAYKTMRINEKKNKLPKSVAKLLNKLPDEDAELVRNKLTGK